VQHADVKIAWRLSSATVAAAVVAWKVVDDDQANSVGTVGSWRELGPAHSDSGYVAVDEAGQPYTPDALTRKWHKITKTAGVRPIRLHDARHSCGTALHLRGVPLAVIAKWLGHADAATTARLYAHSQDAALMDAAKSLGGVVTSS
jgi:integrase